MKDHGHECYAEVNPVASVARRHESGEEIRIRIDQRLTQDAPGTLVMLEAMGMYRVKTEVSVQYVNHNIIQKDFKNPDDHLFLRSACQRFDVCTRDLETG
jgi:homoaconitase/3-isopropylmalate dehydratase large subunit